MVVRTVSVWPRLRIQARKGIGPPPSQAGADGRPEFTEDEAEEGSPVTELNQSSRTGPYHRRLRARIPRAATCAWGSTNYSIIFQAPFSLETI